MVGFFIFILGKIKFFLFVFLFLNCLNSYFFNIDFMYVSFIHSIYDLDFLLDCMDLILFFLVDKNCFFIVLMSKLLL